MPMPTTNLLPPRYTFALHYFLHQKENNSFSASIISSFASRRSWKDIAGGSFSVLLLACFFFMDLSAVCLCVDRGEWGSIQWHSALAMCQST